MTYQLNTRRHPRTLQEAFGPYTSPHIDDPKRSMTRSERIGHAVVGVVSVMVLAGLCAAIVAGVV